MTREEAIKKIKEAMPTLWKETKDAFETLVPELAESEDERIRKAIIGIIKNSNVIDINVSHERMLAYLEKQKGKMTAEEYEKSELFQLRLKTKYANGYQDGLAQKEQKPGEIPPYVTGIKGEPDPAGVWKPSEEQMKALLKAEVFLRAGLQYDSAKTIAELYEQLKKL